MPRPCEREHRKLMPDSCGLCKLYLEDQQYRILWDLDGPDIRRFGKMRMPLGQWQG